MLDHVSIAVGDLSRAAKFYDAITQALGVPCVWREESAIGYGPRNSAQDDGHSYLTIRSTGKSGVMADATGCHWCFRAPSRAAVDAFHQTGLATGGHCDGPPGLRLVYPRLTMPPSCLIPMAIASRRFVIVRKLDDRLFRFRRNRWIGNWRRRIPDRTRLHLGFEIVRRTLLRGELLIIGLEHRPVSGEVRGRIRAM